MRNAAAIGTQEPLAERIPAAGLPDVRTRLVSQLTDELAARGGPILETFALHTRAGAQALSDPLVTDPYAQARLLASDEHRRLANAALYWVSPHMTALARAAAPGMPAFRPTPADLPRPYGLMYFAAPFAEADEIPVADTAVFSDGTVRTIKGGTFHVCAATWGPWDFNGAWPSGGTWFTFYTGREAAETRTAPGASQGRRREAVADALRRLPPLRLDNECVIAAHTDGDDAWPGVIERGEGTAVWVHLVLTAFRLMATSRTAQVNEETPIRAVRRRAARAGICQPNLPVRLIDVTAKPRTERTTDGPNVRNYRVRWVVDGHWRNHWYPAAETHRPLYIDAYVKGPEGAPLQVKDTVHLWRDQQEAAS